MRRGTSGLDPIPWFLCSLSTLLGTTELMTPFEEWGHVFIVFYFPAYNMWRRILPTEDICKNPRSPLLVICYLWNIIWFILVSFSLPFSSVQLLSRVRLFMTPWTAARQASLSITNSWSPPKPMSIQLVMPSNHLILCRPLLLLPSVFLSIRVFSNESALHIRWPKYWSFSFNISPSNEHPGLISLKMNGFYLLAVQGTLKSLLQHHSSKGSILRHSTL